LFTFAVRKAQICHFQFSGTMAAPTTSLPITTDANPRTLEANRTPYIPVLHFRAEYRRDLKRVKPQNLRPPLGDNLTIGSLQTSKPG